MSYENLWWLQAIPSLDDRKIGDLIECPRCHRSFAWKTPYTSHAWHCKEN